MLKVCVSMCFVSHTRSCLDGFAALVPRTVALNSLNSYTDGKRIVFNIGLQIEISSGITAIWVLKCATVARLEVGPFPTLCDPFMSSA
eukprot:3171293-Pyramimonas_sp.AAC.1